MKRKALSELTLLDKFLFDETMEDPEAHAGACHKGYQMIRGKRTGKQVNTVTVEMIKSEQ